MRLDRHTLPKASADRGKRTLGAGAYLNNQSVGTFAGKTSFAVAGVIGQIDRGLSIRTIPRGSGFSVIDYVLGGHNLTNIWAFRAG